MSLISIKSSVENNVRLGLSYFVILNDSIVMSYRIRFSRFSYITIAV